MSKYFVSNPISFLDDQIHKTIPSNAVSITDEKWQELLNGQNNGKAISIDKEGNPILSDKEDPTGNDLIVACEMSTQSLLDTTAKDWGYDSLVAAASYANSTNPQFKAEAEALIAWRDILWSKAYTMETGKMPKSVNDFVANLPVAPIKPAI